MKSESISAYCTECEKVDERFIPTQSANSLFKFFDKPEYLFETIEKSAMLPRYIQEDVNYLNIGKKWLYYPMVCFCDIPFHNIASHIHHYGSYGIAFSKEWGERNKVQQIQYINPSSAICDDFSYAFNEAMKTGTVVAATDYLVTQMQFFKPIRGKMINKGKIETYLFTDECEWRYIPDVSQLDLPPVIFDDYSEAIELYNKTLSSSENRSCQLAFAYDEIKYILIPSENDLDELYKVINRLNITDEKKRRLLTKVVYVSNIKEDY